MRIDQGLNIVAFHEKAGWSQHQLPVLVFVDDGQAFECRLRQERTTNCDRGYRVHSEE